jgi:hypothetical protein
MSAGNSDTGTRAIIGLAMLAGSVVLLWLSSPATLSLARTAPGEAAGSFESRLLGLVPHSRVELAGVRAARFVSGRAEGSRSRSSTRNRLVFETAAGDVDLGYVQQRFAPDQAQIAEFLADPSRQRLSLSTIARTRELLRFAFAQLIGALLALGGLGLAWSTLRRLPRA